MTACSMMGPAPVHRGLTRLSRAHSLIARSGTRWVVARGRKTALGHASALGRVVRKPGEREKMGFVRTFPFR